MADKLLYVRSDGHYGQKEALTQSSGSGDGGRFVATDPTTGKLHESMIPASVGQSAQSVVASEDIPAGSWVNAHESGGALRVRKALAVDATKPATGYVLNTVTTGQSVTVYKKGENNLIPVAGYTMADVGKTVWLSASVQGGTTKTHPSADGNIRQKVGVITDVGVTYIVVEASIESYVVM